MGVGIGICVRDADGDLIQASLVYKNIYPSILMSELLPTGEGVALAIDSWASKIIVESDRKCAVDLILSLNSYLNESRIILVR